MLIKICVLLCTVVCVVGFSWGRGDFEKYGPFRMLLNSPMLKCKFYCDKKNEFYFCTKIVGQTHFL